MQVQDCFRHIAVPSTPHPATSAAPRALGTPSHIQKSNIMHLCPQQIAVLCFLHKNLEPRRDALCHPPVLY